MAEKPLKEPVENKSFTNRVHMKTVMVKDWPLFICCDGADGVYVWKREGRGGKKMRLEFSSVCICGQHSTKV